MAGNGLTMHTTQIAWLAGVLEGEASFGYHNGSPTIAIQITDRDVLQRVALLLGVKERNPWRHKTHGKSHYKTVYHCAALGIKAVQWMMTIYVFLGERRQAKVRDILASWKASKAYQKSARGERLAAICHPDKLRSSHGLCNTCHMKLWRARKAGKV